MKEFQNSVIKLNHLNREVLLNETIKRDDIPFREHHLSYYGSYLYLYSPDKSHLIYQESIKQLKHMLKLQNDEINLLKNDLNIHTETIKYNWFQFYSYRLLTMEEQNNLKAQADLRDKIDKLEYKIEYNEKAYKKRIHHVAEKGII